MKLMFLGAGSAFTVDDDNYQSNMLLISDSGKKLLFDCGSDARHALWAQGLTYKDIDDVYISHLHADHAGGLEWLGFSRKFDLEDNTKPQLHIHESLVQDLWSHVLSGGMRSLSGEEPTLKTFFEVKPVKKNGSFVWENIQFQLIQAFHTPLSYCINGCYGLFFTVNHKTIFITADTQFVPDYYDLYYKKADFIFQDCETNQLPSGVHANYEALRTLPSDIKAKMWLYHYNPGKKPDAVKDGFLGFVKKGQIFTF
jgi:ribonuclease BN (tRNA processing enzyme)